MAFSSVALERSFYIGTVVASIIYGLYIYICFHSIYCLASNNSHTSPRLKRLYITYTVVMFVCMSIAFSVNGLEGQMMWIEHTNFPGGPAAYWAASGSVWYETLGSVADMLGNIIGDGLLLYRCYIIWNCQKWLIATPTLIYIASTVLAVISVVTSALPGALFFNGQPVNYAVPWIALSCTFNVVITFLICLRISLVRREISDSMSPQYTKTYVGVMAMLIESALPLTVVGIIFAAALGSSWGAEVMLSLVWGGLVGLCPQLIIHRVAMGRAWFRDTAADITAGSITFADRSQLSTSYNLGSHLPAIVSDALGPDLSKPERDTVNAALE